MGRAPRRLRPGDRPPAGQAARHVARQAGDDGLPHCRPVGRAGTETETLGQFLDQVWLPSKKGRVEASTLDQYSWAVRRRIVPLIGAVRPGDLPRRRIPRRPESIGTAKQRRDQAELALDEAHERHWGPRDNAAIRRADGGLSVLKMGFEAAARTLREDTNGLVAERAAAKERQVALSAAAPKRARLSGIVGEVDHAPDMTRVERVVAMANCAEVDHMVVQALGPVPEPRGGRRVWCVLAMEHEADRDRGRGSPRAW